MTKIFAMIPVRMGSQRLKKKNFALLNKRPLLEYAIIAAKKSKIFDKIYLNSESVDVEKFAKKFNIEFYKRDPKFASSDTTSDEVVRDFFKTFNDVDLLVWVNTTTPFQTAKEIRTIVKYFIKKKADTLITVENKYAHSNYNNKPLNYLTTSKFARTQDLKPVQTFIYSLMMWKRKSFLKQYKKYRSGIFSGKVILYPIKGLSTVMIKTIDNFKLANFIMKQNKSFKLEYFKN
mgnify:FL=1